MTYFSYHKAYKQRQYIIFKEIFLHTEKFFSHSQIKSQMVNWLLLNDEVDFFHFSLSLPQRTS